MTRRVFAAGVALSALVPFALLSAAQAGGKDLDVKGEIKIGNHPVKMEAGRLYAIRVEGKGFQPNLDINPGYFPFGGGGFLFEKHATTRYFVPKETKEYRLYVTPQTSGDQFPEGALGYTLQVKRIPLSKKPLLKEDGKLTADDPGYENKTTFGKRAHHKAFKVTLEAGRFYVIDMMTKGKGGFGGLDPYLYLEDSDGKVVANDDDSGGFPNARIIFRPTKSGEYRVIATALGQALGEFTLSVRSQLKEKKE